MSARLEFGADCLSVQGVVDFDSVVKLEQEGRLWLTQQAPVDCYLDLSGLSRCNSAATALLLSWLRQAAAVKKRAQLRAVTPQLQALLDLAGLQQLLLTDT